MTRVTVNLEGTEPSGLAAIVADLVRQNLERDPDRARLLKGSLIAQIEAPDAEVTIMLRIGSFGATVADGGAPRAHLRVRSASDRLIGLTAAPLRLGLPDPLRPEGRAVLADVLAGRIRIRGLVTHPIRLSRLTRLLSVA